MKKTFLFFAVLLVVTALMSVAAFGQTTIVQWNFEGVTFNAAAATTPSLSAGSTAADIGAQTGGSAFTGLHASASCVWSSPSGNGSAKSMSSNFWGIGDYYQFSFSTTNYNTLSLTWDQNGSATGPRDFKVQWSVDGTNFADASGTNSTYAVPSGITWNLGYQSASTKTLNLSGVTALNNQATVYIRFVDTSTVAINAGVVGTGGTGRVDSVTVIGTSTLPVELSSFTAATHNGNVNLSWTTATEVSNYGFDVERKSANSWSKVTFVEGHGTTNNPQSYSYTDNTVSAGKYSYRLKQIDRDGKFEYSKEVEASVGSTPNTMLLGQNYPNPFNPETNIEFVVPVSGRTTLKVYNMLGEEVSTLVNGNIEAGVLNRVTFKGANLTSGLYFYTLRSGNFVDSKKMLMLK